jgi:hypothetical protein
MSNVLPVSGTDLASAAGRQSRLLAWMREPLLHFIVLGAVLFAVDHIIAGHTDDPHTITVDASVDLPAREAFRQEHGRDPNAEELHSLRRKWLDGEVLYREGIAMQLDKGDPAIRARVIFKVRDMIESGLGTPAFDEKTLRDWFEKNRARYDQPPAYNFEEAALASDASEEAARALVARLNSGVSPGNSQVGMRVLEHQPRDSLVQAYGEEFVASLEASPKNEWRALKSKTGMHVVRVDSVIPAVAAQFDKVGGAVLQDWIDATLAEKREAAVLAMEKRYTVKVTGGDFQAASNATVASVSE